MLFILLYFAYTTLAYMSKIQNDERTTSVHGTEADVQLVPGIRE